MIWLLTMEFKNGPRRYPIAWDFNEFMPFVMVRQIYVNQKWAIHICEIIIALSFIAKERVSKHVQTTPSWLDCAIRGDEAVFWVSMGQQWLVLGGTGLVWGVTCQFLIVLGQQRAFMPLYSEKGGDLVRWHRSLTYSPDRLWKTQLLRSRSGALVT